MSGIDRQRIAEQTAADLLSIKAVFLRPDQPFTWASGIKSPIYCDNRLILGHPQVRRRIEKFLADVVSHQFPAAQTIMGTATAGIAHAALTAELLELPMGYVRGGAKGHGRGNQIEGGYEVDQKTVVIEDLISTGGSSVEAAEVLRGAGLKVLAVLSIFTYGMKRADETFEAAGFAHDSLTDLDTLVKVALERGYLTEAQAPEVLRFRDNPAGWLADSAPVDGEGN